MLARRPHRVGGAMVGASLGWNRRRDAVGWPVRDKESQRPAGVRRVVGVSERRGSGRVVALLGRTVGGRGLVGGDGLDDRLDRLGGGLLFVGLRSGDLLDD